VGEELRHLLADLFLRGEVHDPRLRQVDLTVLEVRMSGDLRHATVFVSQLGRDEPAPEVLAGLEAASGYLGGRAAREMNLKYAPRLRWSVDETQRHVDRIERLLDEGLGSARRSHEREG